MKKIAIITGATGGIGNEFVRQILRYELDEIWAIGRREDKLKELCDTYGEKIVPVAADLSERSGIEKIERMLAEQKPEVRFLVNNAGVAKMAACREFSKEEIIRTIDVNCKAPVLLCNLCIPYMKQGSNILNILIILGITGFITTVAVQKSTLMIEMPFMIAITVILIILGMSGNELTFIEGIIFWILFIVYLGYLYVLAKKGTEEEATEDRPVWKLILFILVGGAVVVWGANISVNAASYLRLNDETFAEPSAGACSNAPFT